MAIVEWISIPPSQVALPQDQWKVERRHASDGYTLPEANWLEGQEFLNVVFLINLQVHRHAREAIRQRVVRLPDTNALGFIEVLSLHPDAPLRLIEWHLRGNVRLNESFDIILGL